MSLKIVSLLHGAQARKSQHCKVRSGLRYHCWGLFDVRPGSVFHVPSDVILAHLVSLLWHSRILKPSQFWEELTLADVVLYHLAGVVEEPRG